MHWPFEHERIVKLAGTAVLCAAGLLYCPATRAQGGDEVTPEVQRLYAEANAAGQRGDVADAIDKYKTMLKLAPHLAPAYNNLGVLYFNERDYAHAAAALKHGLALNANMPTAVAMLGMSYYQLGDEKQAEHYLRAALHADPKNGQVELLLGRLLINTSRADEGVEVVNQYLKANPNDQNAWYLLGKTYLKMSEGALAKVKEIDPDSVSAHEIAGEIDQSMHNYDLALVEYQKAIDKDPHQPGTHMHMGDAYWYMGKWTSAQAEFRAELENDPSNCIAQWKLANSMLEANDSSSDALTQLNQAVDRCPTLMQARVDRARALVRLGKQTEALPDLELAVKDSPNEPTIHFLLAAVYRAQGNAAGAKAEMETYGKLQREASAAVAQQAEDASKIKSVAH